MAEHRADPQVDAQIDTHGHGDPDPEIPTRPLAATLVLMTVIVVVTGALLWPVVGGLVRDDEPLEGGAIAADDSRPPAPLLQANPPVELLALRAWETSVLDRYRWVDRAAGLAQVPVEVARDFVLEHGLPSFPPAREVTP